ncbi:MULTISPECIES: flagellar protein FlaG [unclassified Geobacillus]|uniref:flagellar protein FlaG n=1 Tax=unclassified Geobacillus TaxID=2642459 RepID=UPI000BE372BD|nr:MULTISPECIES: flagellar protein FlaG [unclassified Geobacillus]PDM39199.1 flagellar biosynthesis protein FlaG [Parageobacillus yumthangensis]RDV21168.1 flagellar protein FlaG [Parageobacillus toebii]TXK91547.1 flagellar protein FlaG [Parageobacillus sp. SY1]PUF87763.1 flagellar biosynthesis protein FlaG [Geobacillus sp. LYN3]TXK87923.1 flagellar protein FlaG [Geobacillus sp. AYS3]
MTVERVSSHSPSYFYENVRNEKASSVIESQKQNHASTSETPQQDLPKEKLEEVVKGLNEFLQPSHTSIKFELHDELQEYYVQIVDERTHEVIREIPPKKLLDMYAAMMEFVGLIVDKKI